MNSNVLFTSCGDQTKCHELWTDQNREYDIVAIYYGDSTKRFKMYSEKFDCVVRHKGSKFQNFFTFYRNSNLLDNYERYYIVDDDIVMNTDKVNELFRFSKEHELKICAPSFTRDSKISHDVTRHDPECNFRYTNFVEVNTPLMTKEAVDKLDRYYNRCLIGWGVDWLYTWACSGNNIPGKNSREFAISDQIVCVNPRDVSKNNKRELFRLPNSSDSQRRDTWYRFADHVKCPRRWTPKTTHRVK